MLAVGDRFTLGAVAALIVAAMLSLGVVACGDSDDGGDGASAQASSSGAEEQQIRATLDEMERAMRARDYEAVCAVVTPAARKKATEWEGYDTCAEGMKDALTDDPTGKANTVNPDQPRITSFEINGDTAVVNARRGQKPLEAVLRREDGSWLLERWYSD